MIIRFMKRAGIYNAGEVAGFLSPHEEKVALDYVQRGVAVECDEDGNPVESQPAPDADDASVESDEGEGDEGGEGEGGDDEGQSDGDEDGAGDGEDEASDEGEGDEGGEDIDLESLTKDELVALAEERGIEVTRADGGDGAPVKADYIRALSA